MCFFREIEAMENRGGDVTRIFIGRRSLVIDQAVRVATALNIVYSRTDTKRVREYVATPTDGARRRASTTTDAITSTR